MSARLLWASRRASSVATLSAILYGTCLAQQPTAPQQTQTASTSLITQAVNEAQLTVLKGNTHPLARPEFDLGTAPATLPMQRMVLVLKRSAAQESALRRLLDDQQDKASPSYHKWLTPQQFGKQFGPGDSDIQTITSWLQSHGFQVGATKGRTVLEFSGSASQVQEAFHTVIHKYIAKGEQHWANASDPSIPTALVPAVAGVLTLHNFLKKPQIRMSARKASAKVRPGKRPAITFSDGSHGLAPSDFGIIYSSLADTSSITGVNTTIGVIGRSNLYSIDSPGEDITDFRSSTDFNLCCGSFNIILNGPDPGDLGGGEEGEATLDSTWSGAVAPGATVDLVVSASTNTTDGIDLSEIYIIENNLADIMTESFSGCEADSTSAQAAGTSALAEQAAAQGITYFVATDDSGAEGCDDPDSETLATGPISVNLLASTPFTVAVGGNVFNDIADPSKYWSATNTAQESAISYIPEDVWNDSCLAATCGDNANIAAGGGGASVFFSKPSWQAGVTGIVNDGARDLPDVSLTAAPHDGYVLCVEASCVPNAQGEFFLELVGGTSASTPSFAGIMALVDQQMGGRQGAANYILYRLAASQNANLSECNGSNTSALPASTCVFNDVTAGNNAVPGELNYGLVTAQYQAGAGYDLATGLGSVNIANLVNQWNTVTFNPTTTTLALSPITSITHGTSVNVNVTVAPTSGTGNPSGDVSLVALTGITGQVALGFYTLSGSSTVASSTSQLPGGDYPVTAHYAGDETYAPSDSNQVSVIVTPESSTLMLTGPFTQDQFGDYTVPFISAPFGSPVFLRADVAGASGQGTPSGTVTFSTSSGKIPQGSSASLNSQGTASVQSNPYAVNGPTLPFDAGTYIISASYGGDNSFNPISSAPSQSVSFTITPGFFAAIPANQSFVSISAPGSSGSTSVSVASSTGFSGTIALSCSGLPTGAACTFSPASIQAKSTPTTTLCTINVTTTAATAMLHSPRRPSSQFWLATSALLLLSVVVCSAPGRRRSILLAMLLALIVAVPGCGGGGGSSSQPPPPVASTAAGNYNITVNASSGSTTFSTGFTLFVQ